jgi:ABC-2 type transport system permease protein
MRFDKAKLVFRKDWLEIRRNWQVILPIVLVPLIISVFIPVVLTLVATLVPTSGGSSFNGASLGGFESLIQNLPQQIQDQLSGLGEMETMVYIMAVYFFAPFFLIIPLMASSVIASDSFAGEKERKTIEALLATPLSDSELFLGKILVSFIPSMIITIVSFVVYTVIFDLLSFSFFNGMFLLPNLNWILLIFGLAPTIALAAIGLTVIISAKVKGFREAQQISVILLIPILALVFGQAAGAIVFGPLIIALLTLVFAVIAFVVFRIGVSTFKREEILAKLA